MKKFNILFVLICVLGLAGCNKGVETMYIEGIVVNGIFYDISHQPMPAEVDDSAIIGYIESYTDTVPKKDGETNISKDLIGAPYAEVEGGIALLYKNEWYLCSPMEEATGAPLAPEETDMDLESVSHIEIMSGLTGQKITIKDAEFVQNVMDDIKSLKYEKNGAVEDAGYAYRIRFYNENYDELGRIFITEENGHQISYDGYYYLVEADQNINVDYLEELLKDAPPAEPEASEETMAEIPEFSFTEDNKMYVEGMPGVKASEFVNTSEIEINSKEDVIEQAKKECTVKWYTVQVYCDSTTGIWKIVFNDEGILGGDQTVYMNEKGVTLLIVYGE